MLLKHLYQTPCNTYQVSYQWLLVLWVECIFPTTSFNKSLYIANHLLTFQFNILTTYIINQPLYYSLQCAFNYCPSNFLLYRSTRKSGIISIQNKNHSQKENSHQYTCLVETKWFMKAPKKQKGPMHMQRSTHTNDRAHDSYVRI